MSRYKKKGVGDRKRGGWGMDLYRNQSEGWIAGLCAGLADHWGVPNWMVRLGALALLIFTGALAFWAYVAGWILVGPRPTRWSDSDASGEVEVEYDEDKHQFRKRTVFYYSDSPGERMRKASERLDQAMARVEAMERYMTSRRYDLNREFSKL